MLVGTSPSFIIALFFKTYRQGSSRLLVPVPISFVR